MVGFPAREMWRNIAGAVKHLSGPKNDRCPDSTHNLQLFLTHRHQSQGLGRRLEVRERE